MKTKADIALFLDTSEFKINQMLGIHGIESYYTEFEIPKKNGMNRKICAPNKELKAFQRVISSVLTDIYNQRNHPNVHGFIYNKSIFSNSTIHVNKRYLLNIDLKDFFNTIYYSRIRGLFKTMGLNDKTATIVSNLVCLNNSLPQGAPTSPIISNLICYNLDRQIYKYCTNLTPKVFFTRYADDLTFSTNSKEAFSSIFNMAEGTVNDKLIEIITQNGFTINPNKIKFSKNTSHQEVTGLVTNKKVNIKRKYLRDQIRAPLFQLNCNKIKLEKKILKCTDETVRESLNKELDTLLNSQKHILLGRINFLRQIKENESDNQVYKKCVDYFNNIYGQDTIIYDSPLDLEKYLFRRVYLINPEIRNAPDSQNLFNLSTGSGFFLNYDNEYFFITALHVLKHTKDIFGKFRVGVNHINYSTISTVNFSLITSEEKDFIAFKVKKPKFYFEIASDIEISLKYRSNITAVGFPEYKYNEEIQFPFITEGYINSNFPTKNIELNIYVVSCSLPHGMSGGPVLNHENKVIGFIRSGMSFYDEEVGMQRESGFVSIYEFINLINKLKRDGSYSDILKLDFRI